MTASDPSASADERKIRSLYHRGATDLPSPLIDQQILQQAKAAVPIVKGKLKSVRLQTWRKWQWSSSIAASVVLVSLLFVFNQSYYQGTDLVADDPYIESDRATKNQLEEMTKTRVLQKKTLPQIVSRSEQNVSDIVHEMSMGHAKNDAQIELELANQFLALSTQEKKMQERDEFIEAKALSAPAAGRAFAEKSEIGEDALTQDSDRTIVDYLLLDSLLQKLLIYQQEITSEQSKLTNKLDLSSGQRIQVQIYELLLEYKKQNSSLSVPQKYLNVLSKEQLNELAAIPTTQLSQPIKE